MALGCGAALDSEPRRLVEHDHCLVSVENHVSQHRQVGRPRRLRRRSRRRCHLTQSRDQDRLARPDAVPGAGAFAVDADAAGPQQSLELAVAQTRVMAFEPTVEPERPRPAVHRDGFSTLRHSSSPAPAGAAFPSIPAVS